MKYQLRPYQKAASDAATAYFLDYTVGGGGLLILPTGSGKSLIIADIAHRLNAPILIFCPSVEILKQNYEKMEAVEKGLCALYSASAGRKDIALITLATIGSVDRHPEEFDLFRFVIIDEAHNVDANGGMYESFLHRRKDRKVVGLTATPFRLTRGYEGGSVLKFLTRTRPRIFDKVLYYCQVSDLISHGFLADVTYFDLSEKTSFDIKRVATNSTGSDYDEESLRLEYDRSDFATELYNWTLRTLSPKDGTKRNGVLVFTRFIKESEQLVERLTTNGIQAAVVTGSTPKKERARIAEDFKNGKIKVIANSCVYITGFDYPALDTVILAAPTKSLARYYQEIGRIVRPYQGKKSWCIDLTYNYKRFGKVADLKIGLEKPNSELWAIFSKGTKLTNTTIV